MGRSSVSITLSNAITGMSAWQRPTPLSTSDLEGVQKRDQRLLFFGAEVHLEALIVEIH
jgi:hypothetical protein